MNSKQSKSTANPANLCLILYGKPHTSSNIYGFFFFSYLTDPVLIIIVISRLKDCDQFTLIFCDGVVIEDVLQDRLCV